MSRKKLAWANKEVETFVCILGEEDVVYDVYVAAAAIDIRPTTKVPGRWSNNLVFLQFSLHCEFEVEETFPRLEGLDWTLLDSKPEPERTSLPGQGPRPERRDGPGFGGHWAPGSSTMENHFTTPQRRDLCQTKRNYVTKCKDMKYKSTSTTRVAVTELDAWTLLMVNPQHHIIN
ncbi:unnamed protein product [Boreogadus saida]